MAGVSQHLLQDDNTRKFIYEFIDQHGGVERATQETKVYGSIKRAPSAVDREARRSSESLHQQKPALPSRNSNSGAPPPPPPPRPHHNNHPQVAPPPPPKEKSFPPEKEIHSQPPSIGNHSAPPPPPPPRIPSANGGAMVTSTPRGMMANGVGPAPPPPPPPPPPTLVGGRGASEPSPVLPLPVPNVRNDLLAQIRQRPALNPVSQQKIEKPEKDSRTTLMSEIRKREYELKPVTLNEGDTSPGAPPGENSMAAMLARALEGRAKAIQDESDSEDEDVDEDEDEWDDN